MMRRGNTNISKLVWFLTSWSTTTWAVKYFPIQKKDSLLADGCAAGVLIESSEDGKMSVTSYIR